MIPFINPFMLFGLLGVSVPIIIHLLNRYRSRKTDWAAMELLRRVLVVRGPQVRFEDLLLLLLRCLAITLLALAFARPLIRSERGQWLGKRSLGVLVLLDGSYSMGHRAGVDDRFGLGKQMAREVLKTLEPGVPLTFALMGKGIEGSRRRVLYRSREYDPGRLEQILADLKPLPERLNLDLCLEDAKKLFAEIKAAQKECYIISDATKLDWENSSERSQALLREMGREGRVVYLPCITGMAENLVISQLKLHSGFLRKGGMARYAVEVSNTGGKAQHQISVSLAVNGVNVDERVIPEIPPRKSETVFLFARFEDAGITKLTAHLGSDPLLLDNMCYAVAYVPEVVRVLCVDGDPGKEKEEGETYFLTKALDPMQRSQGEHLISLKSMLWHAFHLLQAEEYDIIILANVPDVPSRMVNMLWKFVEQGGGLIVLPGDKVVPEVFNSRLIKKGVSLLPGDLLEAEGDAKTQKNPRQMEVTAPDHPLARPLRLLPEEILRETLFFRYFKIKPHKDSQVILSLSGGMGPLLVEKRFGDGRVLLFASTADRDWTNFPIKYTYPILLHRAVMYLTARDYEQPYVVAAPMAITVPVGIMKEKAIFTDPAGEKSVVNLTQKRKAELNIVEKPGFYTMSFVEEVERESLERKDGDKEPPGKSSGELPENTLVAAANVDALESDVRSLTVETLAMALKDLPLKIISRDQDVSKVIHESRVGREFWWQLMLLALLVLLGEFYLAHRFGKRTV